MNFYNGRLNKDFIEIFLLIQLKTILLLTIPQHLLCVIEFSENSAGRVQFFYTF